MEWAVLPLKSSFPCSLSVAYTRHSCSSIEIIRRWDGTDLGTRERGPGGGNSLDTELSPSAFTLTLLDVDWSEDMSESTKQNHKLLYHSCHISLWDTKCQRKLTSNLVSQMYQHFPLLKFDMSLRHVRFEIFDKIFSLTDISVSREFSFYFTFS